MAIADRIYLLHALTPLHVGAGRGDGYIDLPVMREKVTGFPFVPGSSTKGVVADSQGATDQARDDDETLRVAFGAGGDDLARAGALVFTDARLVCLPVRSLYGTFAWCTCPLVLQRLNRDLQLAGFDERAIPTATTQAYFSKSGSVVVQGDKAYLEDLNITVQGSPEATAWAQVIADLIFADDAWKAMFTERFLVLPDDVFGFLATTGTEVQAHIRIDPDYKRVVDGALWYEESLPAETILIGLVKSQLPEDSQHATAVLTMLQDAVLQMGGKATSGKGQVQVRFRQKGTA